jgi:hypothetical protein
MAMTPRHPTARFEGEHPSHKMESDVERKDADEGPEVSEPDHGYKVDKSVYMKPQGQPVQFEESEMAARRGEKSKMAPKLGDGYFKGQGY